MTRFLCRQLDPVEQLNCTQHGVWLLELCKAKALRFPEGRQQSPERPQMATGLKKASNKPALFPESSWTGNFGLTENNALRKESVIPAEMEPTNRVVC